MATRRGDKHIQDAARVICGIFKRSPVFRIGRDEFAVILRSEDYKNREALSRQLVSLRQHRTTRG